VLSAVIWAVLIWAERSSNLAMIMLRLPSTAIHEASHWVTAAALCSSLPSFPSIIPRREGGGWVLGSVNAQITWFSSFPVGMAPLLLLPGFWAVHRYTHIPPLYQALALPFVIQACTPSGQDFRVAFSTIRGSLFWIGVLAVGILLIGDKYRLF
jgi:hypothetical protein